MGIFDALEILLSTSIYKVPMLLFLIGAIIYCISNFSKHPAVSRRVLIGLVILLAMEFISSFVPLLNVYLLKDLGTQTLGYVSFVIGLLFSLFFAVALGIIFSAVWMNRTGEKY